MNETPKNRSPDRGARSELPLKFWSIVLIASDSTLFWVLSILTLLMAGFALQLKSIVVPLPSDIA